jgi:bifunctional enzyme CysN/CysC
LTGRPSAGKTTLARAIEQALTLLACPVVVVDGDELRRGLSSDLGFSAADRAEQARRAAQMAALISRSGVVAVVALVSPYEDDRRRARQIHDELGLPFFEVWVDTPLDVCEDRDANGLYARVRAGDLKGLTGVDAPYEQPTAPALRVSGASDDPVSAAERAVRLLLDGRPA